MLYIDCRLASISVDKVMTYGILPSLPGYEMVPRQLYYGQTDWREYPESYIDSAWSRTKIFQSTEDQFYLPFAELSLGSIGYQWIVFRIPKTAAVSQYLGHRRAAHLRALRQLAAKFEAKKVD